MMYYTYCITYSRLSEVQRMFSHKEDGIATQQLCEVFESEDYEEAKAMCLEFAEKVNEIKMRHFETQWTIKCTKNKPAWFIYDWGGQDASIGGIRCCILNA